MMPCLPRNRFLLWIFYSIPGCARKSCPVWSSPFFLLLAIWMTALVAAGLSCNHLKFIQQGTGNKAFPLFQSFNTSPSRLHRCWGSCQLHRVPCPAGDEKEGSPGTLVAERAAAVAAAAEAPFPSHPDCRSFWAAEIRWSQVAGPSSEHRHRSRSPEEGDVPQAARSRGAG